MFGENKQNTHKGSLHELNNAWNEKHDLNATGETVKQLLAGGTPNWVRWPEDYKAFAKEAFAAEKERSDLMASRYQMEDQESLTNEKARKVNPMRTIDFINKLRKAGIKCFVVDNGMPKTVGLWCLPPKEVKKARYVCFMQVPAMFEWSVLRVDRHGLPNGEAFRGWRTVVAQLIEKQILTEYQAHQIFGKPSHNQIFSRYHQTLWELRNGRQYDQDELHMNEV